MNVYAMKKYILGLIIICVVISLIIVINLVNLRNKNSKNNGQDFNDNTEIEDESDGEISLEDYAQDYLNAGVYEVYSSTQLEMGEACIKSFITYIQNDNANAINGISYGNTIFRKQDIFEEMKIQEMYRTDNSKGKELFMKIKTGKGNIYFILMKVDLVNETFELEALSSEKYNNITKQLEKYRSTYTEIPKNEYNYIRYAYEGN